MAYVFGLIKFEKTSSNVNVLLDFFSFRTLKYLIMSHFQFAYYRSARYLYFFTIPHGVIDFR